MTENSGQVPAGFDLGAARLARIQHLRRYWLALAIAGLAATLLFVTTAWTSEFIEELIESIGFALIGIAIIGRLWCTLYIGGRKSGEIVRTGPYSVMRNPLYFFSSIGAVGVGAQSESLIIAFLFGVLCVAGFRIVIAKEEKFLRGKFGAAYADFVANVPRFLPNFRLFRDEAMLSVYPKRIYSTLIDGMVFFSALPAFELIEYLQEIGSLPVLLRLY